MNAHRIENPVRHRPKRLYTTEEAAGYLGLSRWVFTKMIRDGLIPYVQAGKKKLVDIHDLDKWVDTEKTRHI